MAQPGHTQGIPAKSGNEQLAETGWLSSGVVISSRWPHLAGAHPTSRAGEQQGHWNGSLADLESGRSFRWPRAPSGEVSTRFPSRGWGLLWLHLPGHGAVVSS